MRQLIDLLWVIWFLFATTNLVSASVLCSGFIQACLPQPLGACERTPDSVNESYVYGAQPHGSVTQSGSLLEAYTAHKLNLLATRRRRLLAGLSSIGMLSMAI